MSSTSRNASACSTKRVHYEDEFPGDTDVAEDCLIFMQKTVLVVVSQILRMRRLLPVSAFSQRSFDDVVFYTLNSNSVAAAEVVEQLKKPIATIRLQMLKQFVVAIRSPDRVLPHDFDASYCDYAEEAYTIQLVYGIHGSVVVKKGADESICELIYNGPNDVKGATVEILRTVGNLSKVLLPLPYAVDFYFRATFSRPDFELNGYDPCASQLTLSHGCYSPLGSIITGHTGFLLDVHSEYLPRSFVPGIQTPLCLDRRGSSVAAGDVSHLSILTGAGHDGHDELSFPPNSTLPLREIDQLSGVKLPAFKSVSPLLSDEREPSLRAAADEEQLPFEKQLARRLKDNPRGKLSGDKK